MTSDEESDWEEEHDNDEDLFYLLENNGEVAPFAFQPMYETLEIEEWLKVYREARDNNTLEGNEVRDKETSVDVSWFECKKCSPMETEIERKCCKSSLEIIDRKFEDCECISDTDGFRDVCMNKKGFGSSTRYMASLQW